MGRPTTETGNNTNGVPNEGENDAIPDRSLPIENTINDSPGNQIQVLEDEVTPSTSQTNNTEPPDERTTTCQDPFQRSLRRIRNSFRSKPGRNKQKLRKDEKVLPSIDKSYTTTSDKANDGDPESEKYSKRVRHKPRITRFQKKVTHTTYFPLEPENENWIQLVKKEVNDKELYDTAIFPRGYFTLITFINRPRRLDIRLTDRKQVTKKDAKVLIELFLKLGFVVEWFDNPSTKEIDLITDKAAIANKSCCCACAVLSHGIAGKFYSSDGDFDLDELLKKFQTPEMAGKPKLFILQVDIQAQAGNETPTMSMPEESDFVCAYSTTPGHYLPHGAKRSFVIKKLVQVFRQDVHKEHVVTMLARVIEEVRGKVKNDKHVPSVVSQLSKRLIIHPQRGPLQGTDEIK